MGQKVFSYTSSSIPQPTISSAPKGSFEACFSDSAFSTTDYFANSKFSDAFLNPTMFSVVYSNTYKLVHNLAMDEYYILHCTQNRPNLTDVQSKTFIHIPVTNFAAVDTRAIGFLDLLGHSNTIVYSGNTTNVTSPCVSPMPAFFDQSGTIDRTKYDLAIYPQSALNDPNGVALGMDYSMSPLQLAEWVKYIALFTNQEKESEVIFNKIRTNYESFKTGMTQATIPWKRNITVMSYDPSSTRFNVLQDVYFKNLTADAGGLLTVPLVAQPGDPSTMKGQLQNSSLVIDITPLWSVQNYGYWQSWLGYSDSDVQNAADAAFTLYKTVKPYQNDPNAPPFERNNQLWRLDLVANNGAPDWWTRGFARPDLLLQDLIQAQFPDFFHSRNRMFMRHFSDNENSQVATSDLYGCTVNALAPVTVPQYTNDSSDVPPLDIDTSFPLAGIIALGVVGGFIALACIAGAIVLFRRRSRYARRDQ
ncbi:hypothetical protein BDF14DRAFT_1741634 [Spinellus fusiger]|nr:hypothetical protein BDF14DRAFT_1741634 [Spinellus fusiger]